MESSRGPPRVKNKQAAPVQISAEQLLREAVDRQDTRTQVPTHKFSDLEELQEYQGRKRREFEDYVRRNRINVHNWLRYAAWEIEQKDFRRARSIFERALDVNPTNIILWLRYIESEMKSRNINHARNLLDRAVTIMPRVDKLWYKYVYMEETLGNVAGTRQVFERWMSWEPNEEAWSAYINLEKRYGEFDRARAIYERFTIVHPEPRNWIKWARFEEENGTSDLVREVYGAAIESLGDEFMDEKVIIAYAKFEIRLGEHARARAIYKFALDRLPRSRSVNLHKAYTQFEKQFGDQDGVENVVIAKRRVQYQELLRENPKNYDAWFDYARLEESSGDVERTREVYERAIAQLPPTQEKRHWRRYIYLWIFYALWEELETKDIERARQIYDECLKLIPHRRFTFAKIWLLKAQFEIRQMEVQLARKTLGRAIGLCPKDKLFKGYIELEMKMFEFGRCRILHEKQVEWNPANTAAWIKFAELEAGLIDFDRARAIFELAVGQDELDMPELVWKAYIDFEEMEGEYDRARRLYERLLRKTNHVKVWISYALFEVNVGEGDEGEEERDGEETSISETAKARTRKIFQRAHQSMKDEGLKEERLAILNAWESFEQTHGTAQDVEAIRKQLPRRVKRRRKLDDDSFEEYIDYIFPADQAASVGLSKLQQKALEWKAKQLALQQQQQQQQEQEWEREWVQRDREEDEERERERGGSEAPERRPDGEKEDQMDLDSSSVADKFERKRKESDGDVSENGLEQDRARKRGRRDDADVDVNMDRSGTSSRSLSRSRSRSRSPTGSSSRSSVHARSSSASRSPSPSSRRASSEALSSRSATRSQRSRSHSRFRSRSRSNSPASPRSPLSASDSRPRSRDSRSQSPSPDSDVSDRN